MEDSSLTNGNGITREIVAKLWNLCNILRDDGITYTDYVTELTFLLFLKMLAETGREERLPEGYRWDGEFVMDGEAICSDPENRRPAKQPERQTLDPAGSPQRDSQFSQGILVAGAAFAKRLQPAVGVEHFDAGPGPRVDVIERLMASGLCGVGHGPRHHHAALSARSARARPRR